VQGINHSVAGDKYGSPVEPFPEQIFPRPRRWGKMQIGQMADETPVYLFGKRVIFIFSAETGLDMTDFNPAIKSSQRGGHGGGRIPLDNNPIGGLRLEHFIEPHQKARRQPGQRLVFLHHVEVIIRLEVKNFEKRFDHFPVLTGKADDRLKSDEVGRCSTCAATVTRGRLAQRLDDWCQLDDFWPCAENNQHLDPLLRRI